MNDRGRLDAFEPSAQPLEGWLETPLAAAFDGAAFAREGQVGGEPAQQLGQPQVRSCS
jgi:hypothetical protein